MQERGEEEREGGPERPHPGRPLSSTLARNSLRLPFIPICAVQCNDKICTSVTEMKGLSGEENNAGDEFIVTGASPYSQRTRARYFSGIFSRQFIKDAFAFQIGPMFKRECV